jgi:transcriptional regulator with XRE-family HTH domain
MLQISQAELAKRAGISKTGLANIEIGKADSRASTLVSIQRAFEAAGVEFINGGARIMAFTVTRLTIEDGNPREDFAPLHFAEKQLAIDYVSREISSAKSKGMAVIYNHQQDYWWFAPDGSPEQRRLHLRGPLGRAVIDLNADLNIQSEDD